MVCGDVYHGLPYFYLHCLFCFCWLFLSNSIIQTPLTNNTASTARTGQTGRMRSKGLRRAVGIDADYFVWWNVRIVIQIEHNTDRVFIFHVIMNTTHVTTLIGSNVHCVTRYTNVNKYVSLHSSRHAPDVRTTRCCFCCNCCLALLTYSTFLWERCRRISTRIRSLGSRGMCAAAR